MFDASSRFLADRRLAAYTLHGRGRPAVDGGGHDLSVPACRSYQPASPTISDKSVAADAPTAGASNATRGHDADEGAFPGCGGGGDPVGVGSQPWRQELDHQFPSVHELIVDIRPLLLSNSYPFGRSLHCLPRSAWEVGWMMLCAGQL